MEGHEYLSQRLGSTGTLTTKKQCSLWMENSFVLISDLLIKLFPLSIIYYPQPTIVHLNQQRTGGSTELQDKVWELVRPVLEQWTGQHLAPVSLYGIRLYHNNSILTPHVRQLGQFLYDYFICLLRFSTFFADSLAFSLEHFQVDRFPLITSAISK